MSVSIIWFAYIVGAALALATKWLNWICTGKIKFGKNVWTSTKEWFSLALLEDKASWLATIAVVWVIGSVYINDLVTNIPGLSWLPDLPMHVSFAFLFGVLAEIVAPNILKRILKFFTPEG